MLEREDPWHDLAYMLSSVLGTSTLHELHWVVVSIKCYKQTRGTNKILDVRDVHDFCNGCQNHFWKIILDDQQGLLQMCNNWWNAYVIRWSKLTKHDGLYTLNRLYIFNCHVFHVHCNLLCHCKLTTLCVHMKMIHAWNSKIITCVFSPWGCPTHVTNTKKWYRFVNLDDCMDLCNSIKV